MIVDCISDLHGHYPKLEGGDLLIVAGDLTGKDTELEVIEFFYWLRKQDYKKMIFISGNHDNCLQKYPGIIEECVRVKREKHQYLCDSGTEFEWLETEDTKWGPKHLDGCRSLRLKIWGSPWTKRFKGMNPNCMAFTVDTEEELAEKWALIPDDTDILVTHCPGYGMKDGSTAKFRYGSKSLLRWQANYDKTLKLHVFGHIHEGYGVFDIREDQKHFGYPPTTVYVNASHVNEHYQPVNKPIRIIL